MDKNTAIKVENVSKTFRIPHERISSLRGVFVSALKKKTFEEFQALDKVSFEVKKGEFFGIIGRNGSGKSTLLKVLAGIYKADGGQVRVNGLISPFLELGIGFNPELSGRDNIYLNATVLGLSQKQIDEKFDSIVAFSELERFIDQKVKNYSSGMYVRLAFSVAIHANREILLMDEVLAVGDSNFQNKCLEEFNKYRELGKTVILVSHDIRTIQQHCDRVALMSKGKIVSIGNPQKVVDDYMVSNMTDEEIRIKKENEEREMKIQIESEKNNAKNVGKEKTDDKETVHGRYGSKRAIIKDVKIFDHNGKETCSLKTEEKFKVTYNIKFNGNVKNPVFGVMFRKNPKENLYGIHSNIQNSVNIGMRKKGDVVRVQIEDVLNLNPGIYYMTVAIADQQDFSKYESLDVLDNFNKLNIYGPRESWGVVYSKPKISFN